MHLLELTAQLFAEETLLVSVIQQPASAVYTGLEMLVHALPLDIRQLLVNICDQVRFL
jgi:hypothetical protein